MLDDDARTAALSAVVLQLHRGCRLWPAAAFQDRACELLADVLPFDAALWGAENPHTQNPVVLQPYQVPDAAWALYLAQGLSQDPLLAAARAAVGTSVVVTLTPPPEGENTAAAAPCLPPVWVGLGLGWACGLGMAQLEPLSKLRSFFCIWRSADRPPFSAHEQRLLQFVMPHLMETARESQLARLADAADAAPPRSHAVCDLQGALQHLDDRCQALLRMEWPQWAGGFLPAPLLAVLKPAGTLQAANQPGGQLAEGPAFVGRRIAVRLAITGRTALLAVRLRAPSDKLSARQRSIAELYASGLTGPEIAQRLGLAASTVNNHLGDVFKKLQVSSKLQLARVLKGDDA